MAGGRKLRVAAQSRRPKTDGPLMAEVWVGRSGVWSREKRARRDFAGRVDAT